MLPDRTESCADEVQKGKESLKNNKKKKG